MAPRRSDRSAMRDFCSNCVPRNDVEMRRGNDLFFATAVEAGACVYGRGGSLQVTGFTVNCAQSPRSAVRRGDLGVGNISLPSLARWFPLAHAPERASNAPFWRTTADHRSAGRGTGHFVFCLPHVLSICGRVDGACEFAFAHKGRTMTSQTVMYEAEYEQIKGICDRLVREASSKVVFLVDKNGQLIASSGDTGHLDTTSLASLTAGNIAATGGIAKLINEKEFSQIFHEGEFDNLHISIIGQKVILVVIFDQRSSLGLVRLRVRKASDEINHVFSVISQKGAGPGASPFAEISDDDIDSLFSG
jgi:predicted regulator of Ras-like GTPase activity (Roadblock/LC7/MglB family)